MAANIGLLAIYVRSKGMDDSIDSALRLRVRDAGDTAVADDLLRSYDQFRRGMRARYEFDLPADILANDSVALSRLVGRASTEQGLLKEVLPRLRLPMDLLAERVDARSAFPSSSTIRPVARQKPGDDFGGFSEPNWGAYTVWGCGEWRQYGELLVALGSMVGMAAVGCIEIPGCGEAVGAAATALAGAGGLVLYFVVQFCATTPEP
jgi:hypothetical protein